MKNTFCLATAVHGSIALPFVVPSAAEGSAVPRTFPGNVSTERWGADLQFSRLILELLFDGAKPRTCPERSRRGSAVRRARPGNVFRQNATNRLPKIDKLYIILLRLRFYTRLRGPDSCFGGAWSASGRIGLGKRATSYFARIRGSRTSGKDGSLRSVCLKRNAEVRSPNVLRRQSLMFGSRTRGVVFESVLI